MPPMTGKRTEAFSRYAQKTLAIPEHVHQVLANLITRCIDGNAGKFWCTVSKLDI